MCMVKYSNARGAQTSAECHPPYQERSASQLIPTRENDTTSLVSKDNSSVSEHSSILPPWSEEEESDWFSAAILFLPRQTMNSDWVLGPVPLNGAMQ